MENYGTNLAPTFNKNQDLVPWIVEQKYIKMLIWHFPNNPDMRLCWKFPKQHLNVWLFSNPGDDILFLVNVTKQGSQSVILHSYHVVKNIVHSALYPTGISSKHSQKLRTELQTIFFSPIHRPIFSRKKIVEGDKKPFWPFLDKKKSFFPWQ